MSFAVDGDNRSMFVHIARRHNLLALFSHFVTDAQSVDPAASLVGLDKAFAARIQIANSSFSSYKSGSRPIGPRIARQIESLLQLDRDWMDLVHQEAEPDTDEVELNRFLKLATRSYRRATPVQRQMLTDMLRLSLGGTKSRH